MNEMEASIPEVVEEARVLFECYEQTLAGALFAIRGTGAKGIPEPCFNG